MDAILWLGWMENAVIAYALAYLLYLLIKTASEIGGKGYECTPYDDSHLVLKRKYGTTKYKKIG